MPKEKRRFLKIEPHYIRSGAGHSGYLTLTACEISRFYGSMTTVIPSSRDIVRIG